MIEFVKPPQLAELVKASSLLYDYLRRFEPTWGGKLVADARYKQPFERGKWGLRVVLSGHFCASVGHTRRRKPVSNHRNTSGSPDQYKTNKKGEIKKKKLFLESSYKHF